MLEFIYRGGYSVKLTKDEGASRGTRWCRIETTELQEEEHATAFSINHAISYTSSSQSQGIEEPRLEDDAQDDSPSMDALQQHVHVYAIADYYQLPALKALALQCFQAGKSSLIPIVNDRLAQIIEVIYSSIPSSDEHIRSEILAFCLDEKKTLLEDAYFVQAIIDSSKLEEFTEEFILGLIHRQQEDLEKEQKSHLQLVEDLQTDIGNLRKEVNDAHGLVKSSDATAHVTAKQLKQAQDDIARLVKENSDVDELVKRSQVTANHTAEQLRQARDALGRVKKENNQISRQLQTNQAMLRDGAEQLLQAHDALARGAQDKDQVSRQLQATQAKLRAAQNSPNNKIAAQLAEFEAIRVCRHCGDDEFEYYLAREGMGYVARCEQCTTRHYSSVSF